MRPRFLDRPVFMTATHRDRCASWATAISRAEVKVGSDRYCRYFFIFTRSFWNTRTQHPFQSTRLSAFRTTPLSLSYVHLSLSSSLAPESHNHEPTPIPRGLPPARATWAAASRRSTRAVATLRPCCRLALLLRLDLRLFVDQQTGGCGGGGGREPQNWLLLVPRTCRQRRDCVVSTHGGEKRRSSEAAGECASGARLSAARRADGSRW